MSFLSPRNFGLVMPVPITELASLRRLKLLRVGSKQFAPLLLPPGFAHLAATLTELVLECADWPAIPQVTHLHASSSLPHSASSVSCQLHLPGTTG